MFLSGSMIVLSIPRRLRGPTRADSIRPTSKPTEGEVPPAGCAGVVCANETNKKKTKWRAFSLLRIAGERGKRGGGGGGNIQHAARTQQPP